MGEMNLKEVLVFIDDLIIFSASLEEHEQRLKRVLEQLREYGLKLAPEKCKFFQTNVKYLDHIVSENGIETNPEKVKALKTSPIPSTLKELQSFLGFAIIGGLCRGILTWLSHSLNLLLVIHHSGKGIKNLKQQLGQSTTIQRSLWAKDRLPGVRKHFI